ncbi:MAG TPA: pentapeptide repeat-containing protein [Bacillota bacterium]|nr:pentapeptide repeat-containing protein [Bacillota bacterium]
MNHAEVLRRFQDEVVQKRSLEQLRALESYFQSNREQLARDLGECYRKFCGQIYRMQRQAAKAAVAYIQFSLLRTAILEQHYFFLIEAYDRRWYLDRQECLAEYDVTWAFRFLNHLAVGLEEARKQYSGQITTADVEQIILAEAGKYLRYVVAVARMAIPEVAQSREYHELNREEQLEVRVGEYKDLSEVVYKEDRRVKAAQQVRKWLAAKLDHAYSYEVFRGLDLAGGDYRGVDLRYADLHQCSLAGSCLKDTVLAGVKLAGSNLEQADLSETILYEADLRRCNLKKACLHNVAGASGLIDLTEEWQGPGFQSVCFQEADLTGADLSGADLRGADFRGACLTGVNFEQTRLTGAVFDRSHQQLFGLIPEQVREISWS